MFHFRHLDENDDINEEENGDEDQTDFDEDDDDDAFDEVLLELSPEEQELYRYKLLYFFEVFYSRDNPH